MLERSARRTPLVSVVVPTFNRPQYVALAVQSALAQSLRDIEVIVQDNASTSDPTPLIDQLGDGRIRMFRNASNIGQTGNIRLAVLRATGKYVAILGDDDLWRPDYLATLVAAMESNDEVVVSFCAHDYIDESGRVNVAGTEAINRKHRGSLSRGVHRDIVKLGLVSRSICAVSAAVYRRAAINWGQIPPQLAFGSDNYINYLAARTHKFCYYEPERLAQLRVLTQSASQYAAQQLDGRERNGRASMGYWNTFYRDSAVASGRRYFAMKRTDNALRVMLCLLRTRGPLATIKEMFSFTKQGLFTPASMIYHLRYGKN